MKNIVIKCVLTLSVISFICLVVGIAYGVVTGDRTLVIMSVIICFVNIFKIWDIKTLEKKNGYIMITGNCIETVYNFTGRYRVCKIQSGDEILEISIPKKIRLEINKEYVFYFKEMNLEALEENRWLRNKMLSENFLGFEKVND